MMLSRNIIRRFRPDVVVGVGGYASGPILRAAAGRNIPTLIQEQNSYAGVTNKLLAGKAAKICVAYAGMEKYFPAEKILLTGNPVRQNLLLPEGERSGSYAHFKLQEGKRTILVIGGSLGAGTLNESILAGIGTIRTSGIQLLWQTGSYYFEKMEEEWRKSGAENITVVPFIREMNRAFQIADVIISRAGAGTISELCIVGKPVILVPSPNVAEDHQTSNARSLANQQAAIMVSDREAVELLVDQAMELIADEQRRTLLSESIKKLAIHDSAQRIADEVKKLFR